MAIAVIDPGHGGEHDRGRSTASGARLGGELEKDLNLAVGRRIAATLPGHVHLTRDGDVNLSLAERAAAARRAGAQAFVSVHSSEGRGGHEIWVHEQAQTADLELAAMLGAQLGAPIFRGRLGVLDPTAHAPDCARCLVELDPHAGVDRLAGAVARGVARFLGAEGERPRLGQVLSHGAYGEKVADFLRSFANTYVSHQDVATFLRILHGSARFRAIVHDLDGRVVPLSANLNDLPSDRQGRVTSGPHQHRWKLTITSHFPTGSRLVPAFHPDWASPWPTMIVLLPEYPVVQQQGLALESLVHETLHFHNLVHGRPHYTGAMAHDLVAFIDEEASVRRDTHAIVAPFAHDPALQGFVVPTPATQPHEVERSFRSGHDRLTYLEGFVLDSLLREAIEREHLDDAAVRALAARARTVHFGNDDHVLANIRGVVLLHDPAVDLFVPPASEALRLMVRRLAVSERWRRFQAANPAGDREVILQDNATALFPPGIAYRSAPAHAAAHALGAPRFGSPLSNGHFGRIVDEFLRTWIRPQHEVDVLHDLLRRSRTFMATVHHLDSRVISINEGLPGDEDDRGHMVRGSFAGRWMLTIETIRTMGNRFVPAGDPDLNSGANEIVVELPTGHSAEARGTFLEHLVHEVMHAEDLVNGVPATNGTLAHDAAAFIRAEGDVRRRTLAIMREIHLAGFHIPTPPMVPRDIERDFRSGDDSLTYLESFVLSWLIRDAMRSERITSTAAIDLDRRAAGARFASDQDLMSTVRGWVMIHDPATGLMDTPSSVALQLMVRKRAVIERWRRLRTGAMQGDREAMRQEHARALFPAGMAYSP